MSLEQKLFVRTRECTHVESLLPFAEKEHPLVWLHEHEGFVGIGQLKRYDFWGPKRILQAQELWQTLLTRCHVDDPVQQPGSGFNVFASFTFSDTSNIASTVIIPRIIIGRTKTQTWITHLSDQAFDDSSEHDFPSATPYGEVPFAHFEDTPTERTLYKTQVDLLKKHILNAQIEKVVLARRNQAKIHPNSDIRHTLSFLAANYTHCWTYSFDGFLGASPEMLLRAHGSHFSSRVLAGTLAKSEENINDPHLLINSQKNQNEHRYAVESILKPLSPITSALHATQAYALELPSLWHIATDITGQSNPNISPFEILSALHPTAAIGGYPQNKALELIDAYEDFDRGRYAGIIGWIDTQGHSEWVLGLRSATISRKGELQVYAGCGIVINSDAEKEWDETILKLLSIRQAFTAH